MAGAVGRLGTVCGGRAAAATGADLVVPALLVQSRVLDLRHASTQVSAQVQKTETGVRALPVPRSGSPRESFNKESEKRQRIRHLKRRNTLFVSRYFINKHELVVRRTRAGSTSKKLPQLPRLAP